ncbi:MULTISPECIES: alpha-isopropylmalate synthase regulatory domain-containing protein [unclassified Motilimonas]|uniref:alpha-isopropylmalate synthase regulatory domain-containing protein n=1 Tax=Motilimonas TaxID=1914248 RepID=UPI001E30C276|nr:MULTISPECIES: alpha-isopropylmalate synthase regulatory domain-containing protein [unclassified Motilimonas]MCE0556959.1 2-isopropylmalate synthase [Motilimonas sp. E26]MDO6525490.1 alpha-isopropylmalate synthase regulatory domain-containing protein [Motilimonas sp. 1_MG-2023]
MGQLNRRVLLMDTTLRDGEQTQSVSFPPTEKVSIAKALLQKLKIDRLEVASARVSEGEKEAVKKLNEWATAEGLVERIEVLGFVDHTLSVDWIKETGGQVLNLLAKGSLKHCSEQLKKSLDQHVADIKQTVDYALSQGLRVNIYLEDWSNGYKDSPQYVYDMVAKLVDSGIEHFMLPDTLGVMSPDEVFDSLSDMLTRFPDTKFDFHPHNDYGLATANAMFAVKAGISSIHCTVNCLGERAGNASLAEVAVVLKDKLGLEVGIDESQMHHISQLVENFSGKRIADNTPIVGADVFTQTSGIHADGDKKGGLYMSALTPERFNRERSYALGKMSGKASLAKNLEAMDIELSDEQQRMLLKRIVKLGDQKASITPEDLPFLVADLLERKDYNHVQLLNCSITSGMDLESVVSIRVSVNGSIRKSAGSGNGGFDAFISAMKQVLNEEEQFDFPELLDYELRIPPGGQTSALTECIVTWRDDGKVLRTRGVNTNQVLAGIGATLRMINIKLHSKHTASV